MSKYNPPFLITCLLLNFLIIIPVLPSLPPFFFTIPYSFLLLLKFFQLQWFYMRPRELGRTNRLLRTRRDRVGVPDDVDVVVVVVVVVVLVVPVVVFAAVGEPRAKFGYLGRYNEDFRMARQLGRQCDRVRFNLTFHHHPVTSPAARRCWFDAATSATAPTADICHGSDCAPAAWLRLCRVDAQRRSRANPTWILRETVWNVRSASYLESPTPPTTLSPNGATLSNSTRASYEIPSSRVLYVSFSLAPTTCT